MVRALKGTLTLCLILGLTNIAHGQGAQSNQPPVLGLLANPNIQKELKLSDEQINKLKDSLSKVWDKYKDDFAKFAQTPFEERFKKMKEINKDANKAMSSVLDDKQLKRYKQIEWQLAGVGALGDPSLQTELKLSDEQKKKLDGLFYDFEKKMEDMVKSGERSQEKYVNAAKDVEKKANDVLTEEQQKNLKELKGQPFQFSQPGTPAPRPPSEK
jgi:hypothetical protein